MNNKKIRLQKICIDMIEIGNIRVKADFDHTENIWYGTYVFETPKKALSFVKKIMKTNEQ